MLLAPAAATPMTSRHLLRALALALLLLGASACVAFQAHPGVSLSTNPPGARVLLDGKDTGYITPCHLGIPRERQRIDMQLDGFVPASVLVEPGGDFVLIYWREASLTETTFRFPLWLNMEDFIRPMKVQRGLEPRRIHVPLESVAQ